MGFIKDFFKSLANNPNVVNDDELDAELNHFLSENSESSKRVAFLEENVALDKDSLKNAAKTAVQKYKSSTSGSSNKVEKGIKKESVEQEIEK